MVSSGAHKGKVEREGRRKDGRGGKAIESVYRSKQVHTNTTLITSPHRILFRRVKNNLMETKWPRFDFDSLFPLKAPERTRGHTRKDSTGIILFHAKFSRNLYELLNVHYFLYLCCKKP